MHVAVKPAIAFFAIALVASAAAAVDAPKAISQSCIECHDKETAKVSLDLTALSFDLQDHAIRAR